MQYLGSYGVQHTASKVNKNKAEVGLVNLKLSYTNSITNGIK